jgi:hypothetical protein
MDDEIEELRDRLKRLSGPARMPVLHELGQALAMRHWRTGVGTQAARADLDAAIEALRECCRWLKPDDGYRPMIAGQLGQLLAARYAIQPIGEADRETGIELMEESLAAVHGAVHRDLLRVELGQLYLGRVLRGLRTPHRFLAESRSYAGEVEKATGCFQAVLDDGPATAELETVARALLELAVVLKGLARPGGIDMGRLARAMAAVQRARKKMAEASPTADVLDRPVAHVVVPEPRRPPRSAPEHPSRPAPGRSAAESRPAPARPATRRLESAVPDLDELRRTLNGRIVRWGDPLIAVSWRLRPDAATDARLVDDWVALATLIRFHGGATVADRLTLAAGLHLRGCLWDEPDPAAVAAVREIVDRLPGEPPSAVALAAELALLLADPALDRALTGAFGVSSIAEILTLAGRHRA